MAGTVACPFVMNNELPHRPLRRFHLILRDAACGGSPAYAGVKL
jgi:hypothetical protein